MSPKRFLDGEHKQHTKSGFVINGPRPTPLKIKQESRTIHRHHHHHQQQQPQIRKPIIIYTCSPKVIHTKPHEFMALVQKLTGKSCSKHQQQQQQQKNKSLVNGHGLKENEICKDFSVDNGRNNVVKSKSPVFNTPLNMFASDIPLFTPNSSDYNLFSPQGFLKLSDAISSTSPNKTTNSFSPGSLVEFMTRLPEY
ncbi:uncharacterized protein LOC143555236 [Bidens hawaiensis]|uniref:uncharacterized protein LOC143555236 n=1 Tax=Bidens hawaiensis TaxID=980011 RepID=UPI00404B33C9